MADTWAEALQEGLVEACSGRFDLAERRLVEAERLLSASPDPLWSCLLANSQALVSARRGDYGESQQFYGRARQLWSDSGHQTQEPNTAAALEWFEGVVASAGMEAEAAAFRRRREARLDAPVDPWKDLSGDFGAVPAASAPSDVSWEEHLQNGLRLCHDGREHGLRELEKALGRAQEARTQDMGLRLFLTQSALGLSQFLLGDYPSADAALQEAQASWQRCSRTTQVAPWQLYFDALRGAGLAQEADLLSDRLKKGGRTPLLNPWEDLAARGLAASAAQSYDPVAEWESQLRSGLEGNNTKALSLLAEKLGPKEPMRRCLTRGALSLAANRQGDYGLAESAYQDALQDWDRLKSTSHREPLLERYVELLSLAGHHEASPLIAQRVRDYRAGGETAPLLNPFSEKLSSSTMQVMSTSSVADPTAQLPPDKAWEAYLQQGMEAAASQRFEKALRALTRALEKAQKIGAQDLRVCLAHSALSVVAQLSGDYSGAERSYEDARRLWSGRVDERVMETFCKVLREAGMTAESQRVKQLLKDSPKEPALLIPWVDVNAPALKPAAAKARPLTMRLASGGTPWATVILALTLVGVLAAAGYLYQSSRFSKPSTSPVKLRTR